MGLWDLELGAQNCDQMMEECHCRREKSWSTESLETNPARVRSVIKKGIIAQGHGVKWCPPMFPSELQPRGLDPGLGSFDYKRGTFLLLILRYVLTY